MRSVVRHWISNHWKAKDADKIAFSITMSLPVIFIAFDIMSDIHCIMMWKTIFSMCAVFQTFRKTPITVKIVTSIILMVVFSPAAQLMPQNVNTLNISPWRVSEPLKNEFDQYGQCMTMAVCCMSSIRSTSPKCQWVTVFARHYFCDRAFV